MVEGSSQGEGSKKRTRKELDEASVKRQKLEDDAEKAELKLCLKIVPKDDKAINIESLATKYPIVDWKTHILVENKIQDALDLYRIVKERFETTNPEEEPSYTIKDSGMQQNQQFVMGDNDEQPADKEVTKADWFKKPERPPTPDPVWNKRQHVDFRPSQT
nr:hypothetical protein [Tanacetum cinerariifolium]